MMLEVLKIVVKAFGKFKPLMKEVFDGLTDEEYNRTAIKEVARVVVNIVTYTVTELFAVSDTKN